METLETIRLLLQQGELVTSLEFSNAYFPILINPRSRKCQSFHLNDQTYQFKGFGLSTTPLEFTRVVKGLKSKGIKNPPLDRQLVAQSPVSGKLANKIPMPSWLYAKTLVNKLELNPQQVFKNKTLFTNQTHSIRQFISLIDLTATEKQVISGHFHTRSNQPFDCHTGTPELKSSSVAPRAKAKHKQGFCSQVAARIGNPQRHFTKSVFELKWSLFVTWCKLSQVGHPL